MQTPMAVATEIPQFAELVHITTPKFEPAEVIVSPAAVRVL